MEVFLFTNRRYSVVSLVVLGLEETILAPLLMKTFSKDPQYLDRNVTGTLETFKGWLQPLWLWAAGNKQPPPLFVAWQTSSLFPVAHNQSGRSSLRTSASQWLEQWLCKSWLRTFPTSPLSLFPILHSLINVPTRRSMDRAPIL